MNARTLIWPAIAALIALALLLAESARSDGHVADEARSSVCVRPGDVPLNDTGDDTPGLKDEYLVNTRGNDSPRVGYEHAKRTTIIRQTYAPSGSHDAHSHDSIEQTYYVLEGSGRVRVGDETFDVEAGTVIHLPPKIEHQITNTGDVPLVNLLISVSLSANDLE